MNKYVNIVNSERKLSFAVNSSLFEVLDYLKLKHSNPIFSVFGPFYFGLLGILRPFSLFSAIGRKLGSAIRPNSVKSDLVGVSHAPSWESKLIKSAGYCNSGNTGFFTDFLNRLPFDVFGVKGAEVDSVVRAKDSDNPSSTNSKGSCNTVRHGTGRVFRDDVVDMVLFDYDGHVYDLEEDSGLMLANGVISSNCKCSQSSTLVDDKGEPLDKRLMERMKMQREAYLGVRGS